MEVSEGSRGGRLRKQNVGGASVYAGVSWPHGPYVSAGELFRSFCPVFVREQLPFGVEIMARDLGGEMFSFCWCPASMGECLGQLGTVAAVVHWRVCPPVGE